MKHPSRWLAIVVAGLLLASVGCGSTTDTPSGDPGTSSPTSSTVAAKDLPFGSWEERQASLREPNGRLMVSAHRGYWNNPQQLPENSIAAFQAAYELGVDFIEIDVRKTADGHFILSHDENLSRTTNIAKAWMDGTLDGDVFTYKVAELTLDQIKCLRLRAGEGGNDAPITDEQVPTLEEAIDFAKGKVFLLMDLAWDYRLEVTQILKDKDAFDCCMFQGGGTLPTVDGALSMLNAVYGGTPLFNWFCGGDTAEEVTTKIAYLPTVTRAPQLFQPALNSLSYDGVVEGVYNLEDAFDETILSAFRGKCRLMFGTYLSWGEKLGFNMDCREVWERLYQAGYNTIQTDSPDQVVAYVKELQNQK